MIIHTMPQRSPEWFEVKRGKLGASSAQAISAQGKGLNTVIIDTMAEYYSSTPSGSYTNAAMERGVELESQARVIYELETGDEVIEVGFVEYNDYIGCSPDGLVGDDGSVEIKCPSNKVYFQYLLDGIIETKYVWQMQMQMLITGRKWCDYVVYNPNYKQSIIIQRVTPDKEAIGKLHGGFKIVKEQIDSINKKMKGCK